VAWKMKVEFGDAFAYNGRGAQPGKFSKGEQNGQEKDPEEIEEDSTDQAALEGWLEVR